MANAPSSMPSASQSEATSTTGTLNGLKTSRGRGTAIVVYMLFLGSVLAVVTAPIGVLIAHLKKKRCRGVGCFPSAVSDSDFLVRRTWRGSVHGYLALTGVDWVTGNSPLDIGLPLFHCLPDLDGGPLRGRHHSPHQQPPFGKPTQPCLWWCAGHSR